MAQIIEIKARSNRHDFIRTVLINEKAIYKGLDHQVDYYFNVPEGRLKLRHGSIEQNLIFYNRANQVGPKLSKVLFAKLAEAEKHKSILEAAYGIWQIVDKQRHIYFVDNIKIHLDEVKTLGTFVEIEAIDNTEAVALEILEQQCNSMMEKFKIKTSDLVENSYSDLIKINA